MAYISTKLKWDIEIHEIVTIHYFEYMKNFEFKGESHSFWEFLYVDKGTVLVWADYRQYQLETGDIIFHKPNEFHSIKSIGEKAPNLVAISFLSFSPAMAFFMEKVISLSSSEKMLIAQIIAEARMAFTTPLHIPSVEQIILSEHAPFGSQQLILLYLELFLIQVRRNHFTAEKTSVEIPILSISKEGFAKSDMFDQIIQYMELHICEQLKIPDICKAFSISHSTLHSLFRKNKNCGVIEYFNHIKIERSKDIIWDGNMNLTEIAHFLSYNSLQHFSKQFKKATGMSPMKYVSSVKGISQALNKGCQIPHK